MAAKTNNATCKTIAVSNLKGGVGKTMTAASLCFGLARQGAKTLLLDMDSQHSLTVSFGVAEPQKLTVTVATVMSDLIAERGFDLSAGILARTPPIFYSQLLLSERLYPLCREIDETAARRLRTIPDREQAHEIILAELVYN